MVYKQTNDYPRAISMYEKALAIWEKKLPPVHPELAVAINNLAFLCQENQEFSKAEDLYEKALGIYLQTLGPDHPHTQICTANLSRLYDAVKAPFKKLALEQRLEAAREKRD